MRKNQIIFHLIIFVLTVWISNNQVYGQQFTFINDQKILVQSDDKIIVAGNSMIGNDYFFSIFRFNKDGGLDNSFGKSGKAEIVNPRNKDIYSFDIDFQSDGKIIILLGFAPSNESEIIRLNSNGDIDNSFNGVGKASMSLKNDKFWGNNISILADNKIIVTGLSNNNKIISIRLDTNGAFDKNFGTNGMFDGKFPSVNIKIPRISTDPAFSESLEKTIVQKDGKILVLVSRMFCQYGCRPKSSVLTRFNKDNSVDRSFGDNGVVETKVVVDDFFIKSDGEIILFQAGSHLGFRNTSVIRVENNGKMEPIFNQDFKETNLLLFDLITIQSDGKIVLGNGIRLIRLNIDGSLDTTFNESVMNPAAFEKEKQNSAVIKETKPKEPEIPKIISGGVLNNKAITLAKPEYTAEAKKAKAVGTVIVQITIDENGNVIEAKATSGNQLLYAAAEKAAKESKFNKTVLSGQPVKVKGVIVFNFTQ